MSVDKELGASSEVQPAAESIVLMNITRNSTADASEAKDVVLSLAIAWTLFVLIVCGNAAVLVAMYLAKNRKSRMNFFITQLALADMSVAMLNVLPDIINRHTIVFYGGNPICKIIKYLQFLTIFASDYVLVALSIDRFDAICRPMNFSSSGRRARILVCLAWGLSAAFSAAQIFVWQIRDFSTHAQLDYLGTQCWNILQSSDNIRVIRLYLFMNAVAAFIVPALIIMACYTIIVVTIWRKGKMLSAPSHQASGLSLRSVRGKEATCTSCDVSLLVFIICWSPYFFYDLLDVYGKLPNFDVKVSGLVQALAPLNSAANPLIYCLFSTKHRGSYGE
ncbi:PREDICTED: cardioacceleratory peptide receptor-like [Priapulus caudatus]|uniref:Cardioacceleratory peptide receptor-like n=1 Tax=Priapulus caudatus TaxID=37621 RepID=A0ABM1DV41_PRICU|nr:PREDICTED: cardioacceleratory peptide receptor-like [Priapulus caudatus]